MRGIVRIGSSSKFGVVVAGLACMAAVGGTPSSADTVGLQDHGPAAPSGRQFGAFATEDADGNRIVVTKLFAGSRASYLFIDVETGETEQVYPGIGGRQNSRAFLSPANKVYDAVGDWMVEVDVPTREVRRVGRIPSDGLSHSFVADEDGVVYMGLYPTATIASYNPANGEFIDHGPINEESWEQYLRPMAMDDAGWIYVGVGQFRAQIVGFNPATGEVRAFVPEEDRERGQGWVRRSTDGHVYADAEGWGWHAMHAGEATPVDERGSTEPIATNRFPDGSRFESLQIEDRTMEIVDAGSDEPRTLYLNYESDGVSIYSMVAGPDGNIWGGTGGPNRFWRFNPKTGAMDDWGTFASLGLHVNQFVRQGGKIYGAVYSTGSLVEFDPSLPFEDVSKEGNPRLVHGRQYGYLGDPDMFGRPYAMLAHPDGKHVIMAGNPARVEVGGGMLIYNVESGEETPMFPGQLIPDQGVRALAALPGGDVLVGSTTAAATAGESHATDALIYRLDWNTREIVDRWVLDPSAAAVEDIVVADDGLVYGLATGDHISFDGMFHGRGTPIRFFVFDPENGEFIHDELMDDYGGLTGSQAPRTMAVGPDGGIYVLFREAIARIEPGTFAHREIVRPGFPITAGIAIQDNRLYFAGDMRLHSYDLGMVRQSPAQ